MPDTLKSNGDPRNRHSSAAGTEPGVEARAPGAREDKPGEQQQEQDLRQVQELKQPVPARRDVLLGRGGRYDRYRHDAAKHQRRRAGHQADGDQRAADQLGARHERGLDFGRRDAERAEVLDQSAQLAELAQPRAEELEPDRDTYHQPRDPLEALDPGIDSIHGSSLPLASFAARSLPRTSWSAARSSGCLPRTRSRSSVAHDTKRVGSNTSTAAVVRAPVRKLISPANWPGRRVATSRPCTVTAARPDASTSTRPGLAPSSINTCFGDASCHRPAARSRRNSRGVSVRNAAAYSICSSGASLTGRRSRHSRAICTMLIVL